jgi:NAD(P)-dependent dehydrogenase (short-subunit alcohol dehydrogenase family)
MPLILVVGATRGLGASIIKQYAEKGDNAVYGTTRSEGPKDLSTDVKWLPDIDLMQPNVGEKLADLLDPSQPIDTLIITAGYFATEDLTADKGPNWEKEQRMYTTSSIAPVFIVHQLVHKRLLRKGSKVVLVSSESGSITLRHPKEGGGNYARHASKAALNMVGKLLSLDLQEQGVIVSSPARSQTPLEKGF